MPKPRVFRFHHVGVEWLAGLGIYIHCLIFEQLLHDSHVRAHLRTQRAEVSHCTTIQRPVLSMIS
jgi:hypothetical protein